MKVMVEEDDQLYYYFGNPDQYSDPSYAATLAYDIPEELINKYEEAKTIARKYKQEIDAIIDEQDKKSS
jgi:hypothetical protein